MSVFRRHAGRIALVGSLTLLAAAGGVRAQQGTDVLLTKTEEANVNLVANTTTPTEQTAGQVYGDQTTVTQPPAPSTTTISVSGFTYHADLASGEFCEASGGGTTDSQNAVHVGPGATTGSVDADNLPGYYQAWGPDPTSWTTGPALVGVHGSGRSDNQGPPNESTSTTYSPDHKYKITTHYLTYQNPVTSGHIRITVSPVLPATTLPALAAPCSSIDTTVTEGLLFQYESDVHEQTNQ
jgi:hypothetical protein